MDSYLCFTEPPSNNNKSTLRQQKLLLKCHPPVNTDSPHSIFRVARDGRIRQFNQAYCKQFQQIMKPRKKAQTQQSDQADDDSQEEKEKINLNRPKVDRILKDNINLKRIIINVSMTQYPVVTEVAEELGWKIQTDPQAGDWDVFWTDFSIEPDILIRMHFHQKINHYPGIYTIARKNLLGLNLMSMKTRFPQEYNFFPLTWMLPSQYSQFRMYYESVTKGKVRTYIVKPQAECQGRGIFLTRNIENIQNGRHYVIQRYVNKPYLIEGLKFDLRIYVLLAGTDPLRVYLFEQGLARFATQPYVQPNSTNLQQNYIHLTNYAINKLNPKFIFNKSANDMSIGHKRSLTSVYKLLEKKGENVGLLKAKINQAIIKTLLTCTPLMSHQYRYSQPEEYSGNMCFHILGFDILITENFEPLMLEVNHTPSFTTDTPLDQYIKHRLIKDTLILMNINSKVKTALFNKAKQYNSQRLFTGKRQIFMGEDKQREVDEAQLLRDEYEDKHLGGFTKIHPVKDPELQRRYDQVLEYATKVYQQQNTLRARMQQKEAKKMLKEQRRQFKTKMKQKEALIKQGGSSKPREQMPSRPSNSAIKQQLSQSQTPTKAKPFSCKKINEQRRTKQTHARLASSQIESTTKSSSKGAAMESKSQVTQVVKDKKKGTKQLHKGTISNSGGNSDKCASRGRLRKRCSEIIDLPYIPHEQKHGQANYALLSQSELIEQRRDRTKQRETISTGSALNFKKTSSYNYSTSTDSKKLEHNIRITRIRKLQQEVKTLNRSNYKTGNFVMPKIFDINLNVYLQDVRQMEKKNIAFYVNRFDQG